MSMTTEEAAGLARSRARNANTLERAAYKYLQNVDSKWQPHEWVVRAVMEAYRRGTEVPAAIPEAKQRINDLSLSPEYVRGWNECRAAMQEKP